MIDYQGLRNGRVVTAFWKAKPQETEAVAGILQKFAPQAQKDPGVHAFLVHHVIHLQRESSFKRCGLNILE